MSASDPIQGSGAVKQAGRPTDGVVSQSPPIEYLKGAMTGVKHVIGEAVVGVGDAVAARVSHMSLGVGGAVSSVSSGVGEVYSNVTENVGGAVSSVSGRMVRCFTLPPQALDGGRATNEKDETKEKGSDDSFLFESETEGVATTPRNSTDSGISSSFLVAPIDDTPTCLDSSGGGSSSETDADSLQEEVVGLCRELGVTETTLEGDQTDVQGRLTDLESRVRALIFDTQAGTRRRRALVHVLVAVREHGQKVSDLSEMAQSVGGMSVKGHLLLQERSHRVACDVCTRTIWDILSSSYACAACHLHVHWSCINHMRRYCPSSYFSSSPLSSPLSTFKRPPPSPGSITQNSLDHSVDPNFLSESSDTSFSALVRHRSASSYLDNDHSAVVASLPTPSRQNMTQQAASNNILSDSKITSTSTCQTPIDGRGRGVTGDDNTNCENSTNLLISDVSGNLKALPFGAVAGSATQVSSPMPSLSPREPSSKSLIETQSNQPCTNKTGSRSSSKSSQSSRGSRTPGSSLESSSKSSKHLSESSTSPSKQSPKSLQRLALSTAAPLVEDGRPGVPKSRVEGAEHLPLSSLITSICPEVGLGAQNFKCAECKQLITNQCAWSEPRLCHYSGLYYCPACHWNDTSVLPALIVRNWDFTQRPVSRCSLQLLQYGLKKPLLDLRSLNPHLFILLQELCEVKKLRENLMLMKQYLLSCRFAVSAKLLRRLAARQHFVDAPSLYSTQDLLDLHTGTLLPELQAVHDDYARHIQIECQVCQGRGHICLNCKQSEDVLYPFEQRAVQCSACYAVMHVECYLLQRVCAKCALLGRQGDSGIIGAMMPVKGRQEHGATDVRRGEASITASTAMYSGSSEGKTSASAGVSLSNSDGVDPRCRQLS